MLRNITVNQNFPLKKGDVLLVRDGKVTLRYEVLPEVSPDRKKAQTFACKVTVCGGRA